MKTIYNRNMNGTPYFGIALLIPLLITGIGVWCSHYPPKTRQALFGYRSPLSMRSERNWMAAQVFVLVATYLIIERKLKKLDASNENI